MNHDLTAIGVRGAPRPARGSDERGDHCAILENAGKVIDTTRRAWSESASNQAQAEAGCRPPRASQPKRRVVPRRSRWPSLVAALNYWSPKPL